MGCCNWLHPLSLCNQCCGVVRDWESSSASSAPCSIYMSQNFQALGLVGDLCIWCRCWGPVLAVHCMYIHTVEKACFANRPACWGTRLISHTLPLHYRTWVHSTIYWATSKLMYWPIYPLHLAFFLIWGVAQHLDKYYVLQHKLTNCFHSSKIPLLAIQSYSDTTGG